VNGYDRRGDENVTLEEDSYMDDAGQVRRLLDEGAQITFESFAVLGDRGYPASPTPEWVSWISRVEETVERICGSGSPAARAARDGRGVPVLRNGRDKFDCAKSSFVGALQVALDVARRGPSPVLQRNFEARLLRAFDRFHVVARQLRDRHDRRSTLDIHDEYDVQDLLHALLRLDFDDIRPEEWTPSYAGGSSRTDFLLKKERVFIEVKKTRQGLGKREVADQLIIDIARYQVHPDCGALYCFVYDPEGQIGNPIGLESDLSRDEPIRVRLYVRPCAT
jgi:hypothetical protein